MGREQEPKARSPLNARARVNEVELRVVGMSRSGNHAIIEWILAQACGRVVFLNCAEAKTNPFATARPLSERDPPYRASYDIDMAGERAGRLSRKDLLVHSYEDTFLGGFGDARVEARHDEWLGASRRRFDLLIVRDPYNLFASRLESGIGGVPPRVGVRIWCQHACEFLGQRRHLRNERVVVSYNAWAASPIYRRNVALRLGLEFDDRAAARVPACGGGSSFDGTSRDGAAATMAVSERWRSYADDPNYAALFTPEVRELARRIFPRSAAVDSVARPEANAA